MPLTLCVAPVIVRFVRKHGAVAAGQNCIFQVEPAGVIAVFDGTETENPATFERFP